MRTVVLSFVLSCLLCMPMVQCEQNATNLATNVTAAAAANNNATAGKIYQLVQTQVKVSNSTEFVKELLSAEKDKQNTTENTARARTIGKTDIAQLSSNVSTTTTTTSTTTTQAPATQAKKASKGPVVAEGVSLDDTSAKNQTIVPTLNATVSNNNNTDTSKSNSSVSSIPPTTSSSTTNTTISSNSSSAPTANATTSTTISSTSTSTTTTTITTTSSTTTTTTTPRPTKPKILYGTGVHPEWEEKNAEKSATLQKPQAGSSSSSQTGAAPSPVLPEPEPPLAQPSQELSSSSQLVNRGSNEYIVPIVTVLLTVPLAIGVIITMYRRFRDFWSTRHYRRMDFLVDGMYND
ncbi:cell wall protein DAN4-like [Scaptodrosophila lebanonensis]|uniref:Cell wall protein DAN4-like n=1 Tax=Drosophila lebanonensis TaxID=7225 RepID=A0A6J2TVU1_DROLE|nr:cell wall protein DAN4-like [Scaptodrosophila lebanonensis]